MITRGASGRALDVERAARSDRRDSTVTTHVAIGCAPHKAPDASRVIGNSARTRNHVAAGRIYRRLG